VASRLWLITASAFALLALLAWPFDNAALLWQPDKPWRAFTAPFAHLSFLHLIANLTGCVVVGVLGQMAQCPPRMSGAWLLAWPLTQWGLLLRPDLIRYGGLSGLLHAGVAIIIVALLTRGGAQHARERRIGLALFAGLLLKLWVDEPFGPAAQTREGWDMAIAPFAHLSGAFSGAICGGVAALWGARVRRNPGRP